MTFAEAAILILKEAGEPLHYQEITRRILERSLVSTNGATPHNTLYAVMHLDEKQDNINSRFIKLKGGVFGLRELVNKQKIESKLIEDVKSNVSERQVRIPFFPKYSELKLILPIWENTNKNQITHLHSTISTLRGTPQSPVNWTNPDEWIFERLNEKDKELALNIWTQSRKLVNPRYTYGHWLLANTYSLVFENDSGQIQVTPKGENFVRECFGETEKFIDENEGLIKILNIIAERGTGRAGEFYPEWESYLKKSSNFSTESTIKDTLRRRLDNLVNRQLLSRSGRNYSITEQGLSYINLNNQESEAIPVEKTQDIYYLVKQQTVAVRASLLEILSEMNPYHFEHLIKNLLESMNYQNVNVTSQSNDKGIDVIADIEFGITSIREVVQVKRQKANIQRTVLDALRGSLHRFSAVRGTIISTGNFTKGAENASIEKGAAPITLINGEKLIDLLIENEIGIKKKNISLMEIDENAFIFDLNNE
ncbi:restriction endonuclease [Synechocystis sp. FACHB-383]|uniref:restriction endonuclease n=1 Tax=Synechocystis sp. FACHB-383 TaxID=2692864 RepID=UPI00168470C7|nr:restriction endonuclease [Synechocystis sp. FACHB-383]MBD2654481.1 restriction endonuclease [Synechocystis sp. FACHB-383]